MFGYYLYFINTSVIISGTKYPILYMSASLENEITVNRSDAALRKYITPSIEPRNQLLNGAGFEGFYGIVPEAVKLIYDQDVCSPELLEIRSETMSGKGTDRPLSDHEAIEFVVPFALTRAYTQNSMGERLGIYAKGKVVEPKDRKLTDKKQVFYTYEPDVNLKDFKITDRKHDPIDALDIYKELQELFPQTSTLSEFAQALDSLANVNGSKPDISSSYAKNMFTIFNGKEDKPYGDIYTVNFNGVPVIVCVDERDIQYFRPYHNTTLPKDTTSISFPISDKSRGKGGIFQDTIAVICKEGTEEESIEQHINSQVTFKKANIKSEDAYPVFHTRKISEYEERIENTTKLYALSYVLKHNRNVNWNRDSNMDLVKSEKENIVLANSNSVVHGIGRLIKQPYSAYYLGDLLSTFEIIFGNKSSMNRLESTTEQYLEESIGLIRELSLERPSREFQLFATSYFSIYPQKSWGTAYANFDQWKGKDAFIKGLNIPRMLIK